MKKNIFTFIIPLCLALTLSACGQSTREAELAPLPPPEPDGGPFGVDLNINMGTIDDFLERPDVAYRDMRMLFDPADFESIGGISTLTRTLPGFRITSLPYIATLSAMPVSGAYEGDTLFDVVWGEGNEILEIRPNYIESELILEELFPKDTVIFLMCGGAGYSALSRALLVHMGLDPELIYSTGGNWYYEGDRSLSLTWPNDAEAADIGAEDIIYATWRANYAYIDFSRLRPVGR